MTPRQARAARAMLGLDMKTVCRHANVGKRTLTEFEAGSRKISGVTEGKIKAFYISKGISFTDAENEEAVKLLIIRMPKSDQVDQMKSKIEYYDLFGAEEALQKICTIDKIIESLSKRPTISQLILINYMELMDLNQKEVANKLGCTASFINTIITGKKSLPILYASNIQDYFITKHIEIAKALQCEREIKNILKLLVEIQKEHYNAWYSLHH